MAVFLVVFAVFGITDAFCYGIAKYPERSEHWWSHAPGSGFLALLKYGKDK